MQWLHAQEWCQRTPGADASVVTDAQTVAYARHLHDACRTYDDFRSTHLVTTANTLLRWKTSA